MDLLNSIELFVKTIDEGNFSEVGRQLHMSPSTISRKINALEQELGVRLLQRTTRNINLTEAGQVYYEMVSKILHDLENAQYVVTQLQESPKGVLRVNVAVPFGERKIVPLIPEFLSLYPELKIDLTLEDRSVDLIEERVDLSIRIGSMSDSSVVARKLADNQFVLCASPQYIDLHGSPKTPQDLALHNCILNKNLPRKEIWQLVKGDAFESMSVDGNFFANSGGALYAAILAHIGIAALPTWYVGKDIKQGRLQQVLEDYDLNLPAMTDSAIYALYPTGQYLPPKVRVFIDYLIGKFSAVDNSLD